MSIVEIWSGDYDGYPIWIKQNRLGIELIDPFWLGYIGIEEGHPWFCEHYDDICADVHGGVTYGSMEGDLYVLGFACYHAGDDYADIQIDYVRDQLGFLARQATLAQQRDILGVSTKREHFAHKLIDLLAKAQMFLYTKVIKEHVWHSQTGKITPIRELRNSHLMNIWYKFEREKDYTNPQYRPIVDEAHRRGLVYDRPHGPG